MKLPDFDDKDLIIVSVLIISVGALFALRAEAAPIINSAFSGLFGMAVGRRMK